MEDGSIFATASSFATDGAEPLAEAPPPPAPAAPELVELLELPEPPPQPASAARTAMPAASALARPKPRGDACMWSSLPARAQLPAPGHRVPFAIVVRER